MRYFYCLLLIAYCLLCFSCGENNKQVIIPADVLPKEKMAVVIADIHIAEAELYLNSHQTLQNDSTPHQPADFQKIFAKNSITKGQYDRSIAFYIDHPEQLNEVYEIVLNELSRMQAGK